MSFPSLAAVFVERTSDRLVTSYRRWSVRDAAAAQFLNGTADIGDTRTVFLRPRVSGAAIRATAIAVGQPFGGVRWWFVCKCGRRCAALYASGERAACRRCLGLVYPSQHEDRPARLRRRAERIFERVGLTGEEEVYNKPKGMHWSTFDRLLEEAQRYSDAAIQLAEARFEERITRLQGGR